MISEKTGDSSCSTVTDNLKENEADGHTHFYCYSEYNASTD